LVADERGERGADRPVEFADDDLRFGAEVVLVALDERLARRNLSACRGTAAAESPLDGARRGGLSVCGFSGDDRSGPAC
jgi:hypothetical protein